jgi:hypothetical protein
MGMTGKLRHVSLEELRAAKKEPAAFYRSLYGIEGKPADRSILLRSLGMQLGQALKASPMGKEFMDLPEARRMAEATWRGKAPDPDDQMVAARKMLELIPKIGFRPDFSAYLRSQPRATKIPEGLELEKSWHCLHYLLSGKVWETGERPIEKAILGGIEIPDIERIKDYGPVRYLEPDEIKRTAAALERFPIKQKASKFSAAAAAKAKIYSPNHSPKELIHYFNLVKSYYREAVSKKHAMLMWVE